MKMLTGPLYSTVRFSFLLVLLCITGFDGILAAQNIPRTRPLVLQINNSARSLALGEATVGLAGYAGAAHINPATIGEKGFIQGGSNISIKDGGPLRLRRPFVLQGRWNSHWTVTYSPGRYAVGLGWQEYGAVDPQSNSVSGSIDQVFHGTFAYRMSEKLWLGAAFNYIYSRTENIFNRLQGDEIEARTFSVDLGAYYQTVSEFDNLHLNTSIGWSLTDFGPTFSYEPDEVIGNQTLRWGLPMTMRLGTVLNLETKERWQRRNMFSGSLYLGLSKELARTDDEGQPYGPFRALVGSWGSYKVDFGDPVTLADQILQHYGLEMAVAEILYGRIGLIRRPSRTYAFNLFSYGFGFDLYFLRLDYTRVKPTEDFLQPVNIWQLTARVPLDGRDGNFWPALLDKISN